MFSDCSEIAVRLLESIRQFDLGEYVGKMIYEISLSNISFMRYGYVDLHDENGMAGVFLFLYAS